MRNLGLGALAHANRHAAYAAVENSSWPELSVLQAGHSAELLIKARIAQEHPLLIFEQLPRLKRIPADNKLDFETLFHSGRTVQWSDLPDRLWAVTGQAIPNRQRFDDFGKLRNGIQHFGPNPAYNTGKEVLRFVFDVLDPFIHECWGMFAIDYDEDYEPYIYLVSPLVSLEIEFLVSREAAECFKDWNVNWEECREEYRKRMHQQVQAALSRVSG